MWFLVILGLINQISLAFFLQPLREILKLLLDCFFHLANQVFHFLLDSFKTAQLEDWNIKDFEHT
jgi:hypothetical protein